MTRPLKNEICRVKLPAPIRIIADIGGAVARSYPRDTAFVKIKNGYVIFIKKTPSTPCIKSTSSTQRARSIAPLPKDP